MPLFTAIFGAFFSALGLFLVKIFAAKLAIRVVAVGVLIGLSVGLVQVFNGYIAPLVSALFSTSYGQFLGLVFPPIAGTCLATMVGAMSAVHVYRLKTKFVRVTAEM